MDHGHHAQHDHRELDHHHGHVGHVGHVAMRYRNRTQGADYYGGGIGANLTAPGMRLRRCVFGLFALTVFLLLSGAVMTGTSYDLKGRNPFFGTSPLLVLGPLFLVLGAVTLCTGIALLVFQSRSGYGMTPVQMQQSSQPVISGAYVPQPQLIAGNPPSTTVINKTNPDIASTAPYPPMHGNMTTPYFPQQGQATVGYQAGGGTVYQTGYGTNTATSAGQPIPPPTDSNVQPSAPFVEPSNPPPPPYSQVMTEKP